VQFGSLGRETIRTVVDKFLVEMQVQLDSKNVALKVEESAVDWFQEHGYSESMGARPMGRLIQDKLKKAIAEDILFGKLASGGGEVMVSAENGQIVLKMISQIEKKERVKKPITEVSS
jgi:ATP-dependent Clp protease ATP-binding subunit ClpA